MSTSGKLDTALDALDRSDSSVAAYVQARKSGMAVEERRLQFDDGIVTSALVLRRGAIKKELVSSTSSFHHCAFSHLFTSAGLQLTAEVNGQSQDAGNETPKDGTISISFQCGLLKVSEASIKYFELVEHANPKSMARSYRLWVTSDVVKEMDRVPSEPEASIAVRVGERPVNRLRGYVDHVEPFELNGQRLIQLSGTDGLVGGRTLVSARFNHRVDPLLGIVVLSAWVEFPALVDVSKLNPLDVNHLEDFLHPTEHFRHDFFEFLSNLRGSPEFEQFHRLCDVFGEYLERERELPTPFVAAAFKNSATILLNRLPVHVVIGSIRGIATSGIRQIAPGVLLAAADQVPFQLRGQSAHEPLCPNWSGASARLITFALADRAPDTPPAGWTALQTAFDQLVISVTDTACCHTDRDENETWFHVDGRQPDCILELDRWYHVHSLLGGTAHQYYAGLDKSTDTLEVDDKAMHALLPRCTAISKSWQVMVGKFPKLIAHLSNARVWISRARTSSSLSERFLCTWIATEYLALGSATTGPGDDIKGKVSTRIARVLAGSNRTKRRYWEGVLADCYDLRCHLVHEAREDTVKLQRLVPLLTHAVVKVLMFCTLTGPNLASDATPSDILDQYKTR